MKAPGGDAPWSCEGAPRDLGLDQGRAARDEIRRAVATLPPAARVAARLPLGGELLDARLAAVGRDLDRHFPHMGERLRGLARGGGVARGELVALLARERRDRRGAEASATAGVLVGIAPERSGSGPLLGRTLPAAGVGVRRSAPDNDYRSEDHTVAWLVLALAGRNEHALAVVAAALSPEPGSFEACAAPAVLLAQDCLQRFDTVQKGVEWCEGRPAGGGASILLADAAGDLAEVVVSGPERRVRRPRDGILLGEGAGARGEAIAKALGALHRIDAAALREVLGAHAGPGPSGGSLVV